jgi:hypothetical protein
MWASHLKGLSRNTFLCRRTSRTNTLSNVRIFTLNTVKTIPLSADRALVEVGICWEATVGLTKNQVTIL